MKLAVSVFRGETLVVRTELLVGSARNLASVGCVYEGILTTATPTSWKYHLFGGLIVEYHIENDTAYIHTTLYDVIETDDPRVPFEQVVAFRNVLRIPGDYSKEGEDYLDVGGGYTFAFLVSWVA